VIWGGVTMAKRGWLRPEREPSEGGMVGFRKQMLLFLGVATFQGGWFLVPWTAMDDAPSAAGIASILLCMAIGLATVILQKSWPRHTSAGYALGTLLLCLLITQVYAMPGTLALFALPVLVAGLLLGKRPGIAMGAVAPPCLHLLPGIECIPPPRAAQLLGSTTLDTPIPLLLEADSASLASRIAVSTIVFPDVAQGCLGGHLSSHDDFGGVEETAKGGDVSWDRWLDEHIGGSLNETEVLDLPQHQI